MKGGLSQVPGSGERGAAAASPPTADAPPAIPSSLPGMMSLTPREREVLVQLVAGDRVASIARELEISQNTVRNHLKSIFRKLSVRSQVELLDRLKAARAHS
jgi:DNA-binding CsgD family transcriptional regulator